MPTFLDGHVNLNSIDVPGVYVDIIPPQTYIAGVPSNREGVVGVGSWGPVNALIPVSTQDDAAVAIGVPMVRKYDVATFIAAATQVGGSAAYYCVRVTDGTDAAASGALVASCLTLTAKYTGTLGNGITAKILAGSKPHTFAISVSFPGRQPETFDNIAGTGKAFWLNAAAAINAGTSTRAKSSYVIATAGAGTTAPVAGTTVTLSGGTDGASGVVDADLIGSDVSPRSGMYALRRSGVDCFTLCDVTDSSTWAAQDAFALSENAVAVHAMAPGTGFAYTIAKRVSVGLDSFPSWLLVGDYPTFYDSYNGLARLVSPAAFALGLAGNLSPEQSPLNKPLRGVIATQHSETGAAYSDAELSQIERGGVDVIVGPPTTPGGEYYTFITGRNASSNNSANGVEYSRLTFFLARSIQSKAAGSIVGRLQSIRPSDRTRFDAKAMMDGFFASLRDPAMGSNGNGMIDDFETQCDLNNNPPALQARGFLFLYAKVRYLNVVRYFVVKLAGGGNVEVTSQASPPSPAQFL